MISAETKNSEKILVETEIQTFKFSSDFDNKFKIFSYLFSF